MIFNKNKTISFISLKDGLEKDDILKPKPYRSMTPDWWSEVPTKIKSDNLSFEFIPTVRSCPAIVDFFSNFYIMPMWITAEVVIENNFAVFNNLTDKYNCTKDLYWGEHPKMQLLDHADLSIGNKKIHNTVKIVTPWSIITPKGYSILVLPPIYSFNQNFTPMPGIIDTDIHHEINIPSMFHSNQSSFTVNAGDPFVTIFPFKRTKYNLNILSNKTKFYDKITSSIFQYENSNLDSGVYRKMQKDRDKKIKKEKWIEGNVV